MIATALTTVVALLSFIFMTDRLSLFYVPLAVSVGIAMLASIFVAFCWMPVALRGTAERESRREAAADAGPGANPFRKKVIWKPYRRPASSRTSPVTYHHSVL